MPEKLSDEDFKYIYSKATRAAVDLVIETANGIVLIKREDAPDVGAWSMPGGGIRFQESVEEGAKRIIKRELGVDIELDRVIGYDEYLHEPREIGDAHTIAIMITARIVGGDLPVSDMISEFTVLPENMIQVHKAALEKFWTPHLS